MKRTHSIETVVDNTGVVISSRGTSYGSGIIFDCSLPTAGTLVTVSWVEDVAAHTCKELCDRNECFGWEVIGSICEQVWSGAHGNRGYGFKFCPYCSKGLEQYETPSLS